MAEITAVMVKALREQTGLGMMDCKAALTEAEGDIQAAEEILRKKGLDTAQKKAGRSTAEGLVAISTNADCSSGAMVEIRCETDFCARNEVFKSMVNDAAELAAASTDGPVEATEKMNELIQAALAKTGENIAYVRGIKISAPRVGTYIHHNGKVGVLVGVEGDVPAEMLSDLCMHIAFADPIGITPDDIPDQLVEKEKRIAKEQATATGKPENIAEKIVIGKVKKFLAQNALLEQMFVKDDKKKVKDVLGAATVTAFARFAVGT